MQKREPLELALKNLGKMPIRQDFWPQFISRIHESLSERKCQIRIKLELGFFQRELKLLALLHLYNLLLVLLLIQFSQNVQNLMPIFKIVLFLRFLYFQNCQIFKILISSNFPNLCSRLQFEMFQTLFKKSSN